MWGIYENYINLNYIMCSIYRMDNISPDYMLITNGRTLKQIIKQKKAKELSNILKSCKKYKEDEY